MCVLLSLSVFCLSDIEPLGACEDASNEAREEGGICGRLLGERAGSGPTGSAHMCAGARGGSVVDISFFEGRITLDHVHRGPPFDV